MYFVCLLVGEITHFKVIFGWPCFAMITLETQLPIREPLRNKLDSNLPLPREELEKDPVVENNTNETLLHQKKYENQNTFSEKILDYSKVVFSRESTYRGFVDIFAEDLPNIVADAFRGKAAFLEACFKSVLTTGYIFTIPSILKQISRFTYKAIFPHLDYKAVDALMLFGLDDLETNEKLNQAKQRILEQEATDSNNQADLYKGFDKSTNGIKEKYQDLKLFINDFNPDDEFRQKMYNTKKNIFTKLSWYTSSIGTLVPIIKRLFRKYILGTDRFVGSMKYLKDKDADKLGNVKGFSLKQILLNLVSFTTIPTLFNSFMSFDKNSLLKPVFDKFKSQIDTRHSYHPKTGLFMPISSLPYLVSKMINSQDRFELTENFVRFSVSCSSLFFGDRATNGVFAKAADKKLSEKHGVEPGILYYKDQEDGKGIGAWLASFFPEAAKINHVIERTKGNQPLQEEATNLFRKIFYKGFFFHSLGTFLLKMFINWTTKARVSAALAKS